MESFSPDHATENIIQTLIELPEFLRKPILESRVKEFFSLGIQDKYEIVSDILAAVPSFETGKISSLVKTWLLVLSNLDSVLIVEMFRLYCHEISNSPEIIQKIPMEEIIKMFSVLESTQRQKITDCIKEAILSFPDTSKIVNLIPESGLKALQIK
jgi:hypothetical protein